METLTDQKRRIDQQDIADFMAGGYCIAQACNYVGVTRQTFYNWLNTDEAFRRIISCAEEEADSEIEAELFQCARQARGDHRYQRTLIYYMERRERRRDRRQDRELRAEECALRRAELEQRKIEAARVASHTGGPASLPLASADPGPAAEAPSPASDAAAKRATQRPKPPTQTPEPETSAIDPRRQTRNPDPATPRSRRVYNIPAHLRPSRQIYHGAPGPIVRKADTPPQEYPSAHGDGQPYPLPHLHVSP